MDKLKGKGVAPVTVKHRGHSLTVDPMEDLRIGGDLNKEMAAQPGLYAHYVSISEEAFHVAKKQKYILHCLKEDLDEQIRRKAARDGEKITEKAIEFRINRSPEVRKQYERYMNAKRKAGLLNVLKVSFEQRASMLQSVGANKRKELEQTDLRTLQRRARNKQPSLANGGEE